MEDLNSVYRIRTTVGQDTPNVVSVPLNQTYDMFEILSLKLNQTNTYKKYDSDYGVIVGRVYANGGFGVPNAKISVFIEVEDDETLKNKLLYNFTSTNSNDNDGVRYNLLPDFVDDGCHQNVGTFPNKRLVLDNNDVLEVFDKYWKYTTTTNHAGDYMLFGIPVGSQTLHVDLDLSDCGVLSQRPRDMMYKGYNETMFDSPNKFKYSTNLNSLAQIITQDKDFYVYPYWGDVTDSEEKFSITRCDVELEYKFESTAVFIGSIITDKGSNAIGKNCTATENNGKMSDLVTGEGTIEMIRKTIDNKVEEFPIMGNRVIDEDGVWCYQIPMNLDYVTTDEFGNLVPTDNPDKGIATRARVRFRVSIDNTPNDESARKRAKYLVPNNPRIEEGSDIVDADYEFGTATREDSYCDLFWNKVYTVKSYIPKLQKNDSETNRKHTGIKMVNHSGDNNPMPYNSLTIKLGFTYRFICILTKIVINLIEFLNEIISVVGGVICLTKSVLELPAKIFEDYMCFSVGWWDICPFEWLGSIWRWLITPFTELLDLITPPCIGLGANFCNDGINPVTYYPGCGYFLFRLFAMPRGFINMDCVWEKTRNNHEENQLQICRNEQKTAEECELTLTTATNKTAMLYNCVENQLAQQNEATSFNFNNDWINGVLYAPLWHRKITPKKSFFFGLFKRSAKDDWCSADRNYPSLRLIQQCSLRRGLEKHIKNFDNESVDYLRVRESNICDGECQEYYTEMRGMNGVIRPKQTMLGQTVHYYKAVEYDPSLINGSTGVKGNFKTLFATDIVLLGSLNECDIHGIPQFFKALESTTYNMPSDILFTDYDFIMTVDENGNNKRLDYKVTDLVTTSEMAGCDWGNPNEFGKDDGGLFYDIGCSSIEMDTKSCVNLSRICEFGVSLDETKEVADLAQISESTSDMQVNTDSKYYAKLVTDGFVSWDELYNLDERSMFATMNGNRLKTKLNEKNGLKEYDFRYLYPENFDGSLYEIMKRRTGGYSSEINYKNNYKLERPSNDYYLFRMGNNPFFYDNDASFPQYENSYYFYFGLKAGKTAIEKFNSKYFAECQNENSVQTQIGIISEGNSWCSMNITEEEFNNLNSDERIFYSKAYVNENDKSDIITVEEWQSLPSEEQENYEVIYIKHNDGYVAFDFGKFENPYDLLINGLTVENFSLEINNITEEKIVLTYSTENLPTKIQKGYKQVKGEKIDENVYDYDSNGEIIEMLENGDYQGVITDANGDITEFNFRVEGTYLDYKINAETFEVPNDTLINQYGNDLNSIANASGGLNTENVEYVKRQIGGVITIYNLMMNGDYLNNYRIEVRAKDETKLKGEYSGLTITYKDGVIESIGSGYLFNLKPNHIYAIGLPQGGITYTVTITQLCGGIDSSNVVSRDVLVTEPLKFKMFINDIDYEIIKNFDNSDRTDDNTNTGWKIEDKTNLVNESDNDKHITKADVSMDLPWFYVDNIYFNDGSITINNYGVNQDYIKRYYTIEEITKGEYDSLPDADKVLLFGRSKENIISTDAYEDLWDKKKNVYSLAYIKIDKTEIISKEEYEVLPSPDEYSQAYINNFKDDDIITFEEYRNLPEEGYYINKTDANYRITEDLYANSLPCYIYGGSEETVKYTQYNSLPAYRNIDDHTVFISIQEYDQLNPSVQNQYEEVEFYRNKQDGSFITLWQWENLSPAEKENYDARAKNGYKYYEKGDFDVKNIVFGAAYINKLKIDESGYTALSNNERKYYNNTDTGEPNYNYNKRVPNVSVISTSDWERLTTDEQKEYEKIVKSITFYDVVSFEAVVEDENYTLYCNTIDGKRLLIETDIIDEIKGEFVKTNEVPEFDSTKQYYTTAIVLYRGTLYRFITAHSGEWNLNDVVKKEESRFYYNWVDKYIVEAFANIDVIDYTNIQDFVNGVNNAIVERKEVPSRMKEVFYFNCVDEVKNISVTSQTDKMPYTSRIVYHPEKTIEDEDINVLDGKYLKLSNAGQNYIGDVTIPTITYKGSPLYGNSTTGDEPCVAQFDCVENATIVGKIDKKPYSVGIMNMDKYSIPTDGNKSFESEEIQGMQFIKETTKLNLLFNFPLIDKMMIGDFKTWTPFNGLLKYNVETPDIVNMNGIVAGYVINGNIDPTTGRFAKQKIGNIEIELSDNLTDKTTTYIERRLLTGSSSAESLNFTNYIVKKEYVNKHDNSDIITEEEWQGLSPEEQENYKEYNQFGTTQYAPIPQQRVSLTIQDDNFCGIMLSIKGDTVIEMETEVKKDTEGNDKLLSVNDCHSYTRISNYEVGRKILNLRGANSNNGTMFYMKEAEVKNGQTYNPLYPMNKAEKFHINKTDPSNIITEAEYNALSEENKNKYYNTPFYRITDEIHGAVEPTKPQNFLSYQTKDLTETHTETRMKSKIEGRKADGTREIIEKEGYGNTGYFYTNTDYDRGDEHFPVFIIKETNDGVRTLSNVYDYSLVLGSICYLTKHYRKAEENPESPAEAKADKYRLGVGVDKNDEIPHLWLFRYDGIDYWNYYPDIYRGNRIEKHYRKPYFLKKYPYTISGELSMPYSDESESYTMPAKIVDPSNLENKYTFTDISKRAYDEIKNWVNIVKKYVEGYYSSWLWFGLKAKVVDITGLTHIMYTNEKTSAYQGDEYTHEWYYDGRNRSSESNETMSYIYLPDEGEKVFIKMQGRNSSSTMFIGWTVNQYNVEDAPYHNPLILDFDENNHPSTKDSALIFGHIVEMLSVTFILSNGERKNLYVIDMFITNQEYQDLSDYKRREYLSHNDSYNYYYRQDSNKIRQRGRGNFKDIYGQYTEIGGWQKISEEEYNELSSKTWKDRNENIIDFNTYIVTEGAVLTEVGATQP